MEKRTRNLVQSVLSSGFQGKGTRKYFGKSHEKFMEVILLWKKANKKSDFLIIPNIITQEMGLLL